MNPGAAGRLAGLSRPRLGPRWRPLELGSQGDCWDRSRENPAREGALSAGGVADPMPHSCFSSHFLLKRGGFHWEGRRLLEADSCVPRLPPGLLAVCRHPKAGLRGRLVAPAPSQPPACCWLLPPTVPSGQKELEPKYWLSQLRRKSLSGVWELWREEVVWVVERGERRGPAENLSFLCLFVGCQSLRGGVGLAIVQPAAVPPADNS